MQKVRIVTNEGRRVSGILNANYDNGVATRVYVNIGATSYEEVLKLGIEAGDMVTLITGFKELDVDNTICGKAFDDRLGYFIIGEVLKRLKNGVHPNTVYFVGTGSEEVRIRGAETTTYKINPDIIFPIDVACFSDEFMRDHTNNRQISKGMMLASFDGALVPNRKSINFIKKSARNLNKELQLDIFTTGGTDGGETRKVYSGKPVAVSCISVRYGHCGYSVANKNDIQGAINIFVEIIKNFDERIYEETVKF